MQKPSPGKLNPNKPSPGKTVISLHPKTAVSSDPSDEDSPKFMLKAKALTEQAGFKKVFAYDLGPKQQPIVWG
jgi:hypothetical protein